MSIQSIIVNAIYDAATGDRKTRLRLTPILTVVLLGSIALLIFISLTVDRALQLPQLLPGTLNIIVAVPVFVASLVVGLWSVIHFFKARGTPVPSIPPPKLITSGPYAYSRNPMHVGLYLLLFTIAILIKSLSLAVIFMPIFVGIDVLELKRIEEVELAKRFGDEYREYQARVPMFLPRLPLKRNRQER